MNDQTAALLRDLAAKLGTTVDHLYSVVLRQVPVWIAINLTWAALMFGVSVALLRFGLRMWRDDEEFHDPMIPKRACAVVMMAFAAPCFGFGVIDNAYAALTGLMNPEFSALTYILTNVRH